MNITNVEVETKLNKNADAVVTNLTINWEDMTAEDIRALAQQALVVKLQGGWRKNGIPAGDFTVKAADHKVGARAPRGPQTPQQIMSKLSDEQKAELRALLLG